MTTPADWADAARRLLDVLRPPAGAAAADPGNSGEGRPAHGGDCRWCPVCQAAAVVRGERPEVTAALADVLATTASVLRDLAGEPARSSGAAADAEAPGPADDRDGDSGPGAVQRIDIA
ncbi:hypothetical protein SAMN05660662_2564 [Blastococcus aurantiacus]|uniref:Uncharacterized protein n=1 Tax=Blastococcus aurantiacus TaxID=1550231 RepID=A0A1G7LXA6_9ACTN|nr:hypothetical protein [Blastococcus aurantiacus]SDF54073.1 hypothetical protein SAMN05660662_2564 [Blastococcus aurantiacus]